MFINSPIFAYFSPETLLPVGSIVATVMGVAMMLGRGSLRFFLRSFRRVFRKSGWIAGVSRPHFRLNEHGEPRATHVDSSMEAMETRSGGTQE
jgi:hypothetical protein